MKSNWLDKNFKINHLTSGLLLVWLPLCAVGLLAQTRVLCHLPTTPGWLDLYLALATAFAYQFQHPHSVWRRLALLLGGAAAACFLLLDRTTQVVSLPLGLLWVAYYYATQLRRLPWAKPLVVAVVWASATVLLPLPLELWVGAGWLWVSRAALVFALALGYDLLDLHTDQQEELPTLARQLGVPRTRQLAEVVLVLAALATGCFFLFENAPSSPLLLAQWGGLVVARLAIFTLTPATPLSKDQIVWRKAALDGTLLVQSVMAWLN